MFYLLTHALSASLLAVLLWLPGYAIERFTLRSLDGAEELRQVSRFVLGAGYWTIGLFALGVAGALGPLGIAVLATLAIAGALAAGTRRGPGTADRERWIVPPADNWLAAAPTLAVVLPLALVAVSPRVSWDADVYHLTLPRLYVAHHGFREVAFNVYSNWPLNAELLYAMALVLHDYVLAKLVHFGFGVLTLYAAFRVCRSFHSATAGWLALPLILANHVVILEMQQAYVDLAYAFFMTAAFAFMLRALEEREGCWLLLSGIACGLMAGTKISGFVGAVVIGTLYLPRLIRSARRGSGGSELRRLLTRFCGPLLLLVAPWSFKALWYTGNPVYPLLHRWFGGPDWSPALGEQLRDWQHGIGMGREPLDYLLLPFRVILSGGPSYARFDGELGAFWIVAVPLALWGARRRGPARQALIVCAIYFAHWTFSSQQIRFLIPVIPLLAVATAIGLTDLIGSLRKTRRTAASRAAFVGLLILVVWTDYRVLPGAASNLRRFLTVEGDPREAVVPEIFRRINAELPPDARVLMLNTNHGFHCEREYVADSFFEASQIVAWLGSAEDRDELRRRLASRGITHVLLHSADRDVEYPALLLQLLRDPTEVTPLFRSTHDRMVLIELRPSADSTRPDASQAQSSTSSSRLSASRLPRPRSAASRASCSDRGRDRPCSQL